VVTHAIHTLGNSDLYLGAIRGVWFRNKLLPFVMLQCVCFHSAVTL